MTGDHCAACAAAQDDTGDPFALCRDHAEWATGPLRAIDQRAKQRREREGE